MSVKEVADAITVIRRRVRDSTQGGVVSTRSVLITGISKSAGTKSSTTAGGQLFYSSRTRMSS